MTIFDKVLYEEGDIVIRKFKDETSKAETVCKSITVENLDNFSYSVIFFESNPKTFHIAFEYEPYDVNERNQYYDAWSEVKKEVKARTKVNKVLKLKKK
jgi:hypothetical protein